MLARASSSARVTVREVDALRPGALAPGDELLAIDGRDVRDLSPAGLHDALSGPAGSIVSLTVLRGETILRVQVRRAPYRRVSR